LTDVPMNKLLSKLIIIMLAFIISSPFIETTKANPTITIMPDGSISPPTALIQQTGDVYTFSGDISDSIEVQRSNIIIDGNHYTLRGGPGSGIGILLDGFFYSVRNVTVRDLVVADFSSAIELSLSSDNSITGNEIVNSSIGVYLDESSHNVISDNTIANNTEGVFVTSSSQNIISRNTITNPVPNPNPSLTYGIQLSAASYNNTISGNTIVNNNFGVFFSFSHLNLVSGNNITGNSNGLYLASAFNNTFSANIIENSLNGVYFYRLSHNNTLSGNTVSKNNYGIYVYNSSDNRIYENNFLNNTRQVYHRYSGYSNTYDLGWPTGGNFWSNYTGVDIYSGPYQNSTGSDGLGDKSHLIDAYNADHYPLMGLFSSHQLPSDYSLSVISNSSTESFDYSSQTGTIKMRVSNTSSTQLFGFMRVTIPKELIPPPYTVVIDATQIPLNLNDTLYDTVTRRWIYFAYQHSTREVSIRGTLPDVMPPTIDILSPENKTYNTKDIPLIFTVGEPTLWMAYSLDGHDNLTVSGNTTIMGLRDGPHTAKIYANDTSGNLGGSAAVAFSVEATPPAIQILSPENKTYSARGVPLTFTVSEPVLWIGYSLDGAPNSSISGNFTISNLLNGTHSVTVCANDTFGNMGRSNTVYFTTIVSSSDTTPPRILITSPENKTYTTTDGTVDIQLTFILNEPVTWTAHSLDKRPNITMTGNATLIGLSEGVHSIVVYALDTAGNTGASSTVYFSVEAPVHPTPTEPFPPVWYILAAIITVIAAGTVVLIYIRKTRKKA